MKITEKFQKIQIISDKILKISETKNVNLIKAPALGTIGVAARGISHQKDGEVDGDEFEVRTICLIFGAQHVI